MRIHAFLLLTAAGAASLTAQTTTATAAPHVLVEAVGPDGFRLRFGPTNLGSLLESEAGRKLWEPRVLPMLGMWQQLLGDEAKYAAARTRLLGYGGRIRLGLWFAPGDDPDHGPIQAALLLDGDGRTDLAALAQDLRDLQARLLTGEWAEQDVGGTKLDVRTDRSDSMTAPLREGEHLLLAYGRGDNLTGALAKARALAADARGKPPAPDTPAMLVRIDLAALAANANAKGNESELMQALGVGSLGTASLALGTAGPQIQLELAQQFTSDERGLFAAVFPSSQGLPALAHLAVPGTNSWKAGRFDFAAIWSTIENARSTDGDRTREELRAESKKELGIDVAADLIAHATDEALLLGSPLQDLDEIAEATWSLAIRLRDEAAFAKGLDALLAKAKPFLSRETAEKHGDVEIRRYGNMFGYDLWFAVGSGLCVMSAGRDANTQMCALLDAAKAAAAAPAAPAPPPLPPDFAKLQRFLPPGLNGIGRGDLDSIVAMPQRWWLMLLGELTPLDTPEEATDEERDAVRALLKAHRLDTLRSATGFADRHWRLRLFW
jgi:hypothetical protein